MASDASNSVSQWLSVHTAGRLQSRFGDKRFELDIHIAEIPPKSHNLASRNVGSEASPHEQRTLSDEVLTWT